MAVYFATGRKTEYQQFLDRERRNQRLAFAAVIALVVLAATGLVLVVPTL